MLKNRVVRLTVLTISMALVLLGGLYYYFFVRVDFKWVFWKDTGDSINWSKIEYDDDFFPIDTVESYGELGEWKFKEFRPIYAGYGTTEDGLNYLIGKYLDEEGKEQSVKILVSGEGMAEWPFPDSGFKAFYDEYYRQSIAVRSSEEDTFDIKNLGETKYSSIDEFRMLPKYELYSCPEEILLTSEEVRKYIDPEEETDIIPNEYFVEIENFNLHCNIYRMYYSDNIDYSSILKTFEDLVSKLELGSQISVTYLESNKNYSDCVYLYSDVRKIFCANQNLNEVHDDFLVAIYLELD